MSGADRRPFPGNWSVSRYGAGLLRRGGKCERSLPGKGAEHSPVKWIVKVWSTRDYRKDTNVLCCEACGTPTQVRAIRYAARNGNQDRILP